jgi:soluble lytic murein transglycosylase-like protein
VAGAIHEAAITYGVSEPWLRRIAYCESRYTPWVTSRGGHMGLYQYAPRTWATFSRWAGYEGASPYDPWSAAMVTAWALRHNYAGHWACS